MTPRVGGDITVPDLLYASGQAATGLGMNDLMERPDRGRAIEGVGKMLGIFPRIASLLVGFTALVYFVGWRESTAFYQEMGALWASELLTTPQIMHAGERLVVMSILPIVASAMVLIDGRGSIKSFITWQLLFLIASFVFIIAQTLPDSWLSQGTKDVFLYMSSFCYALLLGTAVGELLAIISFGREIKHKDWSNFTYLAVILFMLYAPTYLGQARARAEVNAPISEKNVVCVSRIDCSWHVAGIAGDKLVAFKSGEKGRVFKIFETQAVDSITSASVPKTADRSHGAKIRGNPSTAASTPNAAPLLPISTGSVHAKGSLAESV